jgi:hypothetical protein
MEGAGPQFILMSFELESEIQSSLLLVWPQSTRNVLIFWFSKEYILVLTALFMIVSVLVVDAQWRGEKTEMYNLG